jgi:hypothetical protein
LQVNTICDSCVLARCLRRLWPLNTIQEILLMKGISNLLFSIGLVDALFASEGVNDTSRATQ